MNELNKSTKRFPVTVMTALMIIFTVFSAGNIYAQDSLADSKKNNVYLGYSVDLFPVAISAADGKFGYAFQTWLGIDHVKVRLVGARTHVPEFFLSDGFKNHNLTVGALIVDYVFGEDMSGFWIGSGMELWVNEIGHKDTAEKTRWTNGILTLGGGYIWKIAGNLYVNPWVGGHFMMNNHSLSLAGKSYTPARFSASVSVKIGYFFDI